MSGKVNHGYHREGARNLHSGRKPSTMEGARDCMNESREERIDIAAVSSSALHERL